MSHVSLLVEVTLGAEVHNILLYDTLRFDFKDHGSDILQRQRLADCLKWVEMR